MKKIIAISIALILCMPYAQFKLKFFKEKPLYGDIQIAKSPNNNWDDYWSGILQEKINIYINDNIGFRNFLVRVRNQTKYSIFRKPTANGVIIGKENYLYEGSYIENYFGTNTKPAFEIKNNMQKALLVQKQLEAKGKKLIMIFAPGKGSIYPQYIPDKMKTTKKITNYDLHRKYAIEFGVNLIDFNKYFSEKRFKYPVYPKYGIHWSAYSCTLAMDSLTKYIKKNTAFTEIPTFKIEKYELCKPTQKCVAELQKKYDTTKNKSRFDYLDDYDLGNGLNLLFDLDAIPPSAFPIYEWNTSYTMEKNPNILIVGDSFIWGLYQFGLWRISKEYKYWYYNKEIWNEHIDKSGLLNDDIFRTTIEKSDIIIVLGGEGTMQNFGWGFYDDYLRTH